MEWEMAACRDRKTMRAYDADLCLLTTSGAKRLETVQAGEKNTSAPAWWDSVGNPLGIRRDLKLAINDAPTRPNHPDSPNHSLARSAFSGSAGSRSLP